MERDKIKRYYIMPEVWITVTQSQVFNWVKLVNQSGISTDCISIASNKLDSNEVKNIEKEIEGRFIQIKNYKTLIINDIYLSFHLFKYYFKNIRHYEKVIFQTRMAQIGITFALLRILPKAKLIFEARAAKNEELKEEVLGDGRTLKSIVKDFFSQTSEKLVAIKSDKIFCVSHELKNYYLKKFKIDKEKFDVFPGAADSHLFYYSKSLRNSIRKKLNIDSDEIWVVYSGRLEMKWEIPEKIFTFFEKLYLLDQRFRLMIISPDVGIANNLMVNHRFDNIVKIKSAELSEVNNYLNAADVGILLRENIPMNNVASPTKFAEYLMSGLPVIISQGVFDFAKEIDRTGYGVVVSNVEGILDMEYKNLLEALKIPRIELANWGIKNLSKESFINKYISVLQNI